MQYSTCSPELGEDTLHVGDVIVEYNFFSNHEKHEKARKNVPLFVLFRAFRG